MIKNMLSRISVNGIIASTKEELLEKVNMQVSIEMVIFSIELAFANAFEWIQEFKDACAKAGKSVPPLGGIITFDKDYYGDQLSKAGIVITVKKPTTLEKLTEALLSLEEGSRPILG